MLEYRIGIFPESYYKLVSTDFLPGIKNIERVKEKIFEYIDFRIKQGS